LASGVGSGSKATGNEYSGLIPSPLWLEGVKEDNEWFWAVPYAGTRAQMHATVKHRNFEKRKGMNDLLKDKWRAGKNCGLLLAQSS
jgi:hypothetical protein